jgi:hypothetical protein
MDPKGKGMVVNNNEKESIFNEPRDDKANDSGSSQKKKDGKKKRRIQKIVYYDSDKSSSSLVTRTFLSIILVFRKNQMIICFPFLLVNLHTLMERTTDFGVTKCVATCSLLIQVYGR